MRGAERARAGRLTLGTVPLLHDREAFLRTEPCA